MFKPNRWGCLVLSLVALISACGVPNAIPQAPTVIQEAPTARVTQPAPLAASSAPELVDAAPTENAPSQAPTARIEVAPTQVEATPAEKPVADVEAISGEAVPANANKGPSEEQLRLLASLESRGAAPELSNEAWLNSEPLKLADLRGKVVLVEFWTFG